jgi:fructose-bisphosphate aldolase class I
LQEPALKAWQGEAENAAATQQALYQRAFLNGAARTGDYTPDMETETYI